MWVLIGLANRPVKFEFNDLEKYGWKVATQLKHEGDNVYSAPDLQYMMDSPTELSNLKEAIGMWLTPTAKNKRWG
jgi:predicted metalloprotease with PDZ domain